MWIDPLIIYIICHIIELFLFLRYYILLLPTYILSGGKEIPLANPKWLGEAVCLQPAMMDLMLVDVVIDDSKARKVLGSVAHFLFFFSIPHINCCLRYKPQWETEQCIKYTVDEFESERMRRGDRC